MKKTTLAFLSLLLCLGLAGQMQMADKKNDTAFYNATKKWFSAWELVSKEIYRVRKLRPVEFVFFDEEWVYSTSTVSIKEGFAVAGPDLMNLSLSWKKTLHNDTLILPDGSAVPVNLLSFAAEIPGEKNRSFFVMPLPSFWERTGTDSKEFGLDNLTTGVFIHEFSHSQQMQNFGKQITAYEKENDFGVEFSDDLVQHIFSKDTAYVSQYKKEVELLYSAVKNVPLNKKTAKEGLLIMKQRQATWFKEKYGNLPEIDNFFLTMEGLGQYSMYLWLTHPKGANLEKELVIEGVRRNKKWWSQDEGFALFLVLEQLTRSKAWAKDMFGDKTESVVSLINRFMN